MDQNQSQQDRPPTIWFPPEFAVQNGSGVSSSSQNVPPKRLPAQSSSDSPLTKKQKRQPIAIPLVVGDPWQTYSRIIRFQKRRVFLARNQTHKSELANIQQLEQNSLSVPSLVETMSQISSPSLLRLLRVYNHQEEVYLVWEPTELSVIEILASRCPITESELIAIIFPVLRAITYLRDRGRVLDNLTPDGILLTGSGGVRVAGAERSIRTDASKMNVSNLKLDALANIVRELMKKRPPGYEFSSQARDLPDKMTIDRIDNLDNLIRDACFQAVDTAELKLLVNATNKTADHKFDIMSRLD